MAIETPERAIYTPRYRQYVLGILLVVYIFNFIDRQILSILLEPIRQDLKLSDTQLGFLSGVAFAIFYATLGIPIARLADRSSRVNVISWSLAAWSVMTAICGLAMNFWQLMLGRIGVAVGEAGASPASHSLISDYFVPETRASAMGIYAMGVPIGTLIGLLAGGWLVHFFDWRTAFIVVGLPGVLMAIIVRMTVKEPPRGNSEAIMKEQDPVPLKEAIAFLWARPSFRHVVLAVAFHAFVSYGYNGWLPAFFARSYGMGSAEIGSWLAPLIGIFAGLGTFSGGYISDYFARRDRRWYVWVPGITLAISVPFFLLAFMSDDKYTTLALLIVPLYFNYIYLGPTFAMIQGLATVRMRAIASAILLFVISLIGLGLGPFGVGVLSDYLKPEFGEESLRIALMFVFLFNIWAGIHYYIAGLTLREDLDSNPDLISD
ncbi:MAG: spinster family MFS transporter [Pseudomonadota bacterium]